MTTIQTRRVKISRLDPDFHDAITRPTVSLHIICLPELKVDPFVMANFKYTDALDRSRDIETKEFILVNDFALWGSAVHATGYMPEQQTTNNGIEGSSTPVTASRYRRESSSKSSSDATSESESESETGSSNDIDNTGNTEPAQEHAESSIRTISSNEEVLSQAYRLFRLGVQMPPHNVSTPDRLRNTPLEFKQHSVKFMKHQKDAAGRLAKLFLASSYTANEAGETKSIKSLPTH